MRSRLVPVWRCAIVALVALTSSSPIFRPAPVLAASGTVSQETPLLDSPDPAAPVIALLPEGTIVSIDGPPVDGFYPITAENVSGWMQGEAVQVEKDLAASDAAEDNWVDAPLKETDETAPPTEPVPANGMTPGNELVPVDAVAPAPATEGAAQPTIDANVSPIPVAEVATVGPASVMVDAPILAGPGPEYGFIATAPAGSTVEQTGHVINGYATVQYAEVTGWLPVDHLGAPGTLVDQSPPTETDSVEAPLVDDPAAETSLTKTTSSDDTPRAETAPPEAPLVETSPEATAPTEAAPVDAAPAEGGLVAAT